MIFREMRKKKQELSRQEIADILHKGTSGVLALLGDNDYPYAVPISYVYDDGKIYTVYDLAAIEASTQSGNAEIRRFPEEKIAELYENIQLFNAQYHTSVPEEAAGIYQEMEVIVSGAAVSGDVTQAK